MEVWALCGECDRWFYCEGWLDQTVPPPTCPVCGAEPTAIEERSSGRVPPEAAAGTG